MDSVTIDDLKALIEREGGPCVSLFMPTHRAGAETQQDPIRFRNLLRNRPRKRPRSMLVVGFHGSGGVMPRGLGWLFPGVRLSGQAAGIGRR